VWSREEQLAAFCLYDKAFDRGLVTCSDDLKVVISAVLCAQSPSQFHQWARLDIEGTNLKLPARFAPDPILLAFHREHVFQSG
jgi:putative restriction endonuclease